MAQSKRKEGALYMDLCDFDSLRALWYQLRRNNCRNPPEAFVWHVQKSLTEALVYPHYGLPSAAPLLENRSAPDPEWSPVAHGDMILENTLVSDDGVDMSSEYSRIRLADFDYCTHMPRWRLLTSASSGAHRMWRGLESADIRQFLHQMVWFCGGRIRSRPRRGHWGRETRRSRRPAPMDVQPSHPRPLGIRHRETRPDERRVSQQCQCVGEGSPERVKAGRSAIHATPTRRPTPLNPSHKRPRGRSPVPLQHCRRSHKLAQ
jgi:hypothetical protein